MEPRISRIPCLVAALGITMVMLSPRAVAQQAASRSIGAPEFRPGIAASAGELTTEVQLRVSRGDVLTGQRRYAEAQHLYRSAAEIARRQGHLPSLTLWHLACAHYYAGEPLQGAAVLEQLAGEAAKSGDLVTEALALFNAAWLNGEGGRRREAATQVADLTKLLRSPYMPAAVRDALGARLAMPGGIATRP